MVRQFFSTNKKETRKIKNKYIIFKQHSTEGGPCLKGSFKPTLYEMECICEGPVQLYEMEPSYKGPV